MHGGSILLNVKKATGLLWVFLFLTMGVSGLNGISAFGELSIELYSHVFLLIAPFYAYKLLSNFKDPMFDPVSILFLILFFVSVLSLILNFNDISESSLRGRTGINKYFSSMAVLAFAFLFYLFVRMVINISGVDFQYLMVNVIFRLVQFYTIYAVFEILSWYERDMGVVNFVSHYINGRVYELTPFRLRGLSSEPSFFANTLLFCAPFYLFLYGARRYLFLTMLAGLVLLSGSRTAYIVAILMILGVVVYTFFGRGWVFKAASSFMLVILSLFFILGFQGETLGWVLSDSDSVSNLSRFSSLYASFLIFIDNPIVGSGLGQYAFNAYNYIPYWAETSYEIVAWFSDDDAAWPPVFNLYARILSELGILGFFSYAIFMMYMARKIMLSKLDRHWDLFFLMLLLYCILIPISFDSFRNPYIWIALAMSVHLPKYLTRSSCGKI
ncbi:MAG: hypothetical protein COB09_17595 [Thalassobium sp.]|nr:MAG: hypothetical protein COB09_17595 [Thalassobium sp.]